MGFLTAATPLPFAQTQNAFLMFNLRPVMNSRFQRVLSEILEVGTISLTARHDLMETANEAIISVWGFRFWRIHRDPQVGLDHQGANKAMSSHLCRCLWSC